MPVIWEPREGTPANRAHWDAIRARPDFGDTSRIKVQPLAHERVKILERENAELKAEIRALRSQL